MFVQFNEHQILKCGTVLREYSTANIFDEFVFEILLVFKCFKQVII